MRSIVRCLGLFCLSFSFNAQALDPSTAKMNTFINQLMAKMTLEEKAGQLVQYSGDMAMTGAAIKKDFQIDIKQGKVGSVFNVYTPQATRELQRMAVEETRLKIPLIFGYDVIHGHKTIFPIPLAEAGSWDLRIIEEDARIAAREASADGLHWTFAPMVDIARDPRWGRIMEGSGEDPWWGSKVATARVHGFQGTDPSSTEHVMACVKHFAAYGAPVAGREYNVVDMSERELYETYLPTYKAAIDAGAASIMTSFNEIAGVPSTSNRWLLTDLLRKQWGFKGFVVTDYTAVNELLEHGVAGEEKDAGALALKAGVDIDMQGGIYSRHIPTLVKEGKITKAQVDLAVRHVLEAKYKLGLFTDPYRFSDEKRAAAEIMRRENLEQAREAARRSVVLLKNAGNVLPLKKQGTIAVIGPLADARRDMLGNWSGAGDARKAVTILEGIRAATAGKAQIQYARGSNLIEDDALLALLNEHEAEIVKDPRSPKEMIQEAVKVAKKSDVVVLAIGESEGFTGEAASRTNIHVPENQQDLLRALKETGKPLVVVLSNGRPLALELENRLSDALLETWFLGHQAGHGIADVLFGDYNPSAKLTVTFPRSEGQIPIFYAQKNTGRPADPKNKYTSKYLDSPNSPLFPFGYGLSYTKFDYSDIRLESDQMKRNGKLKAAVTVTNSGDRDGEEVVQMYIRQNVASVTRPLKQLRGFQKVALKKSESQIVSFELAEEDLKFYNQKMKWASEPGTFKIMIGPNSADLKEAPFTLLSGSEKPDSVRLPASPM